MFNITRTMAPIATRNPDSPTQAPVVPVKKGTGDYKEQAAGAQAYNKKLEEEGDERHPKANVVALNPHSLQRLLVR